jgi:hypothetical protein
MFVRKAEDVAHFVSDGEGADLCAWIGAGGVGKEM